MPRPQLSGAALRAALPYVLIAAALLVLLVWLCGIRPINRVGDGSEYYAMFYAWSEGGRPWMTPAANAAYESLRHSGTISGMVEPQWFYDNYPELRIGETTDLNHFWFYSLLAVLCQAAAALLHIPLSTHASFLTLQILLIGVTVAAGYRCYGWRGAAVMASMTLFSPVLWYLDKVHTEPFTVCLLLLGMLQMQRARYASASLLFALTSTQNLSFALIAGVPWAYRVFLQWRQRYTAGELALLAAAAVTVLLHPAYYFWRYHVITPQLLAGGAKMGEQLSTFYIWIIDPDLGLLPNWPLGVAGVLLGLVLWLRDRRRGERTQGPGWTAWLFIVVYLAVNFYAHSSTTNLNSGATPGLARYALWYMPLAFPLLLWIMQRMPWRSLGGGVAAVLLLAVLAASAQRYDPRQGEKYVTPSVTSLWLQTNLPRLYNPPPEVFMERYSGYDENRSFNVVVGPDCRKLLLVKNIPKRDIATLNRCLYDPAKLNAFELARTPFFDQVEYLHLSDAQAESLLLTVTPELYQASVGAKGSFVLGDGWGMQEPWGVWSLGPVASLYIPCNNVQFFKASEPFQLSLQLQGYGEQTVTARGVSGELWKGTVHAGGTAVRFTVPAQNCQAGMSRVDLHISNPTSPAQRGEGNDPRLLGIALHSFQVSRLP